MSKTSPVESAIARIRRDTPSFKPKLGLVLGSGLGSIAEKISSPISIPYSELFDSTNRHVEGHHGQLILGTLAGISIACMQGRIHFYEGYDNEKMQIPIRTLKLLGCESLFLTNAAGSLNPKFPPGHLVLINDHINMQFNNPLVGDNDENFGPRFVGMEDAYNADLRKKMHTIAKKLNIPLGDGVYMGVLGPSYETPAEIRAYRMLGADVVGMSTIAEVILARHCGLKVICISTVTNMATGLSSEKLTHEGVLAVGKRAAQDLSRLVLNFIEQTANDK